MSDTRKKTQEEVLELTTFWYNIFTKKPTYWEVSLENWEEWDYDDYDEPMKYTYYDTEIIFDTEDLSATIQQYYDWEYRPVSRLIKKPEESLENFLLRAMRLNERLWETICFEDR